MGGTWDNDQYSLFFKAYLTMIYKVDKIKFLNNGFKGVTIEGLSSEKTINNRMIVDKEVKTRKMPISREIRDEKKKLTRYIMAYLGFNCDTIQHFFNPSDEKIKSLAEIQRIHSGKEIDDMLTNMYEVAQTITVEEITINEDKFTFKIDLSIFGKTTIVLNIEKQNSLSTYEDVEAIIGQIILKLLNSVYVDPFLSEEDIKAYAISLNAENENLTDQEAKEIYLNDLYENEVIFDADGFDKATELLGEIPQPEIVSQTKILENNFENGKDD